MKSSKVLLIGALAMTQHVEYASSLHGIRRENFRYAGPSKKSPSHAQQKRDAKKAKNKGSK